MGADRGQFCAPVDTAQLPVAQWHEMIGAPTIADAILGRLVHIAHRVTLEGDSMRKIRSAPLLTDIEKAEIITA